jgi:hypothetical protein
MCGLWAAVSVFAWLAFCVPLGEVLGRLCLGQVGPLCLAFGASCCGGSFSS